MGFEQFRSKHLPQEEVEKTAFGLIQEFKDAAHEELPVDFQRSGVEWHIDANDGKDTNRLVVTAKSQNEFDKAVLETSAKKMGSIQYEGRRITTYGSATANPGKNTEKALQNTRSLLEKLKGKA